jgi:hypothetical protein
MPRRKVGSLEKLMVKMKKWEPVPTVSQHEVSIDNEGIDIFTWAAGHFEGYKGVDLYLDDKMTMLGVKPVVEGQRSLTPRPRARGFLVACAPLMRQIGVHEKKRVPAEWSERGRMLLIDLRGIVGRSRKR